jgi:hypothetical protein
MNDMFINEKYLNEKYFIKKSPPSHELLEWILPERYFHDIKEKIFSFHLLTIVHSKSRNKMMGQNILSHSVLVLYIVKKMSL